MATQTRRRRSTEERIQALQEEIARLQQLKAVKSSPAHKSAKAALRALSKARDLARGEDDAPLVAALERAVASLDRGLDSTPGSSGSIRRSKAELEQLAADILSVVQGNPDCTMGTITLVLGEPAASIRPTVNELLESGTLRKKGEKRGTRYNVKK